MEFNQEISELEQLYSELPPMPGYRDEVIGRRCCQLALEALRQDCYGVGAVLRDHSGAIIAEGLNQVFGGDTLHCAAHAEMQTLDDFESRYPYFQDRSSLTLIVSLEPCPMCLARIIATGIGQVRYLSPDREGGMVSHIRHLPPAWRNLASLCDFGVADVSRPLRDFAMKLAQFRLNEKRKRLIGQIRG